MKQAAFFSIAVLTFFGSIISLSAPSAFAANAECSVAARIAVEAQNKFKTNPIEGLKLFVKAQNLCPDNAGLCYNLGYAYYKNGYVREAVRFIEAALKIEPGNATYLNNLATIEMDTDPQKALSLARKAYQAKAVPATAHTLGNALIRNKEFDEALTHLGQAQSRFPSDPGISQAFSDAANAVVSDARQKYNEGQPVKAIAAVDSYRQRYLQVKLFHDAYDEMMNRFLAGDIALPTPEHSASPSAPAGVVDEALNLESLPRIADHDKDDSAYAVIVGMDQYRYLPPLKYARRDADNFRGLMTRSGILKNDNGHIYPLRGQDATLNGLNNAVAWLTRKGKLNKDATLIFYFSGHGSPKLDRDSQTIVDGYLIPSDAQVDNINDRTALPLSYMKAEMASLANKKVLVVLDACFSGMGKSVSNKKLAVLKIRQRLVESQKIFISAASEDKSADEYPPGRQGLFTYFFLEGLTGKADRFGDAGNKDNWVDCFEAFSYARAKIADLGYEQNPQISQNVRIRLTRAMP